MERESDLFFEKNVPESNVCSSDLPALARQPPDVWLQASSLDTSQRARRRARLAVLWVAFVQGHVERVAEPRNTFTESLFFVRRIIKLDDSSGEKESVFTCKFPLSGS
jgi:hypothetical protein